MARMNIELPYFDMLLEQFRQGDTEMLQAFGRHVHWGYWDNPNWADGSVEDFAKAAEKLCQRVCDAGRIKNGDRLLDAGCGFGGTIASLNERFQQLQLVGLNIDERQLTRAREELQPLEQNEIEFIQGDACQMPCEDASFDVVLAVECIFHFPSRERFFQEARRVLKRGGRLTICDFVPLPIVFPFMNLVGSFVQSSVAPTYGSVDSRFTVANYRSLAQKTGFKVIQQEDITIHTLPTYPVVRRLFRQGGKTKDDKATSGIEWFTRLGLLRYLIFTFEVC